jgi:hypothetical protein
MEQEREAKTGDSMASNRQAVRHLQQAHDELCKALEKIGGVLGVQAGVPMNWSQVHLGKAFGLYNEVWDLLGQLQRIIQSQQ